MPWYPGSASRRLRAARIGWICRRMRLAIFCRNAPWQAMMQKERGNDGHRYPRRDRVDLRAGSQVGLEPNTICVPLEVLEAEPDIRACRKPMSVSATGSARSCLCRRARLFQVWSANYGRIDFDRLPAQRGRGRRWNYHMNFDVNCLSRRANYDCLI